MYCATGGQLPLDLSITELATEDVEAADEYWAFFFDFFLAGCLELSLGLSNSCTCRVAVGAVGSLVESSWATRRSPDAEDPERLGRAADRALTRSIFSLYCILDLGIQFSTQGLAGGLSEESEPD